MKTVGRPSRPWLAADPSAEGSAAVRDFVDAGGDPKDSDVTHLVSTLGEHAHALVPLVIADPTLPKDVLQRSLLRYTDPEAERRAWKESVAHLEDGEALRKALRRERHRGVVRIALREVLSLADIDRTSAEMAWLAAGCVDAAVAACTRTLETQYGRAVNRAGEAMPFVVLGMGKLGGEELNLGSDVDLCFFYESDDGEVTGSDITLHEYFTKLATRVTLALADVTEDGFCFRVDLRLRPEGSRGPMVNSLASAERYYETWGRMWERAVLLRAKPIAGDLAFGARLMASLAPFVYRRDVDPAIAEEMGSLLRRTRKELSVDEERDIKLGRGGIREAEFFVQALQLVWGGAHPELQVSGTVEAIRRLRGAGLVTDRETSILETDWALLRRVEHRIHVRMGYQTHSVPESGPKFMAFAHSLGFDDENDLRTAITTARTRIAELFATLGESEGREEDEFVTLADLLAQGAPPDDLAPRLMEHLAVKDTDEALAHLGRLSRRPDAPMGIVTRERLPKLAPLLLREVSNSANPDAALRYLAEFFSHAGATSGYEKLLAESPQLTRRLIALFGASPTLSDALVRHPESMNQALLEGLEATTTIDAAHAELFATLATDAPPDMATFIAMLRRQKREVTLRIGISIVANEIGGPHAELLLTHLAECQLRAALMFAQCDVYGRYGVPMHSDGNRAADLLAVGMGSLGARELGIGSDLDLFFLYDEEGHAVRPGETDADNRATNTEVFTRVAQRALGVLTQADSEGEGYAIDTRLRPGGSQGTLVVSIGAFDRYHTEHAEPWERQALIRSRPIAGSDALAKVFEARRLDLLRRAVPDAPRMAELRGRMQRELSGERPGRYHPKFGFGALVDGEFIVQFLQLKHGQDASVLRPHTLDALQVLTTHGHISEEDVEVLRAAYRFFRQVERSLRLLRPGEGAALLSGSRDAEHVARQLRVRDRDAERTVDVLVRTWWDHAHANRALFERIVHRVDAPPGWETH